MKIYQFKTRNFTLTVESLPESAPDLSFDDSGAIEKQIDCGEIEIFTVRASISCHGYTLSDDFLGNCIYASPAEFRDHLGMRKKGHGSYFSDMVRTVCIQARENIKSIPKLRK